MNFSVSITYIWGNFTYQLGGCIVKLNPRKKDAQGNQIISHYIFAITANIRNVKFDIYMI